MTMCRREQSVSKFFNVLCHRERREHSEGSGNYLHADRFKRKYTQFVQAVLFTVEIVCMCLYSTLTYILVCELQLRRFGNACSQ